jgi:GNAT superfamily N-acetyltransferase
MTDEIRIVKCTVADVKPHNLDPKRFEDCTAQVVVDTPTWLKTYEHLITEGRGAMFKAWVGDKVAGALGCIKGPDLHSPRLIAIETFWWVAPEYGGKGIGKKLLDAFEQWAKDENCDDVAMVHLSDSYPESLEQLYIRRGYALAEKHYVKHLR